MHAGAIRIVIVCSCVCAGDNPLAKACGLSSCIDTQTIHCIMTLAHFLWSMLFIKFDKTLSFSGEKLKLYSFFLDLKTNEDIQ